uniref:Cadherin domain-containing protein n=1 Tax=Xiphophorus couchianus TaxID=32473 RepID=A0A3B5LCP8_9TELE
LKRRKRGWVVPPLNVAENHRGPYPLALIRSDIDKVKKIYYKITGPGANEFPVGLFTMDRDSGHLYVTQDLDREKVDKYMLFAHAEAAGGVTNVEEPMEIIINVIDQNDNKPVVATDADEPNTDNSDIRYRIMSQKPEDPSPNMFTINPATGAIRVNEAGLDREVRILTVLAHLTKIRIRLMCIFITKRTDLGR